MSRHSLSGESRSHRPKPAKWHRLVYSAGVLCALVATLTALRVIKSPIRHDSRETRVADSVASSRHLATDLQVPQRRIFPYSVIPGGVENAYELRNAIAHDPRVAQLYANFDLSHARIERLTSDREVYVAYRYDDRIYWTKKRLLLRAGETVITDGSETGRTRCGNRVSDTPMQPTRQDEPPDAAAGAPLAEIASNNSFVPELPLESAYIDPRGDGLGLLPQAPNPQSLNPPLFFPLVGGGTPSSPGVIPPPPPPVPAPEPGALPLLALGFIAVGIMQMLRIRKSHES